MLSTKHDIVWSEANYKSGIWINFIKVWGNKALHNCFLQNMYITTIKCFLTGVTVEHILLLNDNLWGYINDLLTRKHIPTYFVIWYFWSLVLNFLFSQHNNISYKLDLIVFSISQTFFFQSWFSKMLLPHHGLNVLNFKPYIYYLHLKSQHLYSSMIW